MYQVRAISGYFLVSARSSLSSTLDYIVMQTSKEGKSYRNWLLYYYLFFFRLREITSSLKKQSAMLEEIREIFTDKKRRPKRDEPMEEATDITEFYV